MLALPTFNPFDLCPVQVIAPEEIVDPNVDEHSVMTYLSQFPKAKLKPGAPLRSKTLHPKKAKAYGPGEGHFFPNQDPTLLSLLFSFTCLNVFIVLSVQASSPEATWC